MKKNFPRILLIALISLIAFCVLAGFSSEANSAVAQEPIFASEVSNISEDSTFWIKFLDVGQADSALIQCDGHYALIDGGNKADSSLIYAALKAEQVPKLDLIVGTHAHEDHIGGLPGALNYTTADLTLCPVTDYDTDAFSDFKKYAELNGGGITIPVPGDTYVLSSAQIVVLGLNADDDPNNTSIVLKVIYGDTSFLFTGDAEREAEQAILNSQYADMLPSTVLKVGHHGSASSTSYQFLWNVMPKYAVISVGEDNSYGHPTEEVLSRLRDADVKVYRTDMQGTITCTSDGNEVTFSVEKNPDADTLANAGAGQNSVQNITSATATAGTDYVLNTNTKKFHYPSCSSVSQMKDKNKQYYTGSRDDIIAMGYSPCGRCNP